MITSIFKYLEQFLCTLAIKDDYVHVLSVVGQQIQVSDRRSVGCSPFNPGN